MKEELAVRLRYSAAALAREAALCCPIEYDPQYLEVIPDEVIARDYGCGDPSAWLKPGETVLDLGSGTGKICFIAAQVVGAEGKVIGVDMNDDMLEVARGATEEVAAAIGYDNVEFRKGRIQDLVVDRDRVDAWLREHPVTSEADLRRLESFIAEQKSAPLIAEGSIDAVVSNCVLNLVATEEKEALFQEIHRVLKKGGRAIISDIVADERVPLEMQKDPELWSGCISGAFQEAEFLQAFEDAGFYGVELVKRDEQPWQTVEGYEFRSATVIAYKGKEGPCLDHKQAVVYKGPFKSVVDDDGHTLHRGHRMAVCAKTYALYTSGPYAEHFYGVEPLEPVAEGEAPEFPCTDEALLRHPRETKGEDYDLTEFGGENCC